MTSYDFAISGQHYLFDVQSFAHTILAAGGDAFSYALFCCCCCSCIAGAASTTCCQAECHDNRHRKCQ